MNIYQVQQLTASTYGVLDTTTNTLGHALYASRTMAERAADDMNSAFNAGLAHAEGLRHLQDTFVDGRIDEVGVWPRVLTAGEIFTLYNEGAEPSDTPRCADHDTMLAANGVCTTCQEKR